MGAAVTVELSKPLDASDIRSTNSLVVAKNEIIRLRENLGHLAKNMPGFSQISYDASDLCLGVNEMEDFERCIKGIEHIRRALQLSTQKSRRQTRFGAAEISAPKPIEKYSDSDEDSINS